MFQISKDEPKYFTSAKSKVKHPKIKEAWNDNTISEIRANLREYILMKEQKSLCVYCEKKIKSHSANANIDHFKTRNLFAEETLNYHNLLVSCNIKGRCSSLKDSKKSILKNRNDYDNIINPIVENPNDFFDYLFSGEIVPLSDKAKFTMEIFNLNQQSLSDERKLLADTLMYCKDLSIDEIFENFGEEFHSFIENIYPKLKEL
ncbi:MAG: Unknown protein [uncultured Sulfurovum sp.]|uniref:TIGR02646 family protein n=1 Tax=uncultured Sulfurovum sp. TaxID=269237 RepID=A0A6S6T7L0_9BACT|nr:MAG: Unknown protein [uncultured Sulfurovum sp.]